MTKERNDGNEAKLSLCQELTLPTSLLMLRECEDQRDPNNTVIILHIWKCTQNFILNNLRYYFENLKLHGKILSRIDSLPSIHIETNNDTTAVATQKTNKQTAGSKQRLDKHVPAETNKHVNDIRAIDRHRP
jgi:hypothetical protein